MRMMRLLAAGKSLMGLADARQYTMRKEFFVPKSTPGSGELRVRASVAAARPIAPSLFDAAPEKPISQNSPFASKPAAPVVAASPESLTRPARIVPEKPSRSWWRRKEPRKAGVVPVQVELSLEGIKVV